MLLRLVGVSCFLFFSLVSVSSAQPLAYVSVPNDDLVIVFDTATNERLADLPAGDVPFAVEVTPDGSQVWVASGNDQVIWVYDTETQSFVTTFDAAGGSFEIEFSSDGQLAYLANTLNDNVTVIDATTLGIVTTLDMPPSAYPLDLVLSPDDSRVYVALNLAGSVAFLDATTNTITNILDLGGGSVENLALSPDGQRLYIGFFGNPGPEVSLKVIDTETEQVVETIALGVDPPEFPRVLTVSPDGQFLYVGIPDSGIWKFDTTTLEVVDTVDVPDLRTGDLAIHPDGRRLYALGFLETHVIDLETFTLIETLDIAGSQIVFGQQPPPVNPLPIPTLNSWALAFLSLVLAAFAVRRLHGNVRER